MKTKKIEESVEAEYSHEFEPLFFIDEKGQKQEMKEAKEAPKHLKRKIRIKTSRSLNQLLD